MDEYNLLIGTSKLFKDVIELAEKAAKVDLPILLIGESGTGKELFAKLIKELSNRADKKFVAINCSAIPEGLFESELFGHSKGSYTDAKYETKGLLQQANGGTLFLDEITTLSKHAQIKLLRVLETGDYFQVGNSEGKRSDFRLISATNIDPKKLFKLNIFRKDLYYRISTLTIQIPSLRDRPDDIPLLCNHILNQNNLPVQLTLTDQSIEKLKRYTWPGNVRELKNVLLRSSVVCSNNLICVDDIDFCILEGGDSVDSNYLNKMVGLSLNEALNKFKKNLLEVTLDHTDGNRTKAAHLLDIERTYLQKLLKRYGVDQ